MVKAIIIIGVIMACVYGYALIGTLMNVSSAIAGR